MIAAGVVASGVEFMGENFDDVPLQQFLLVVTDLNGNSQAVFHDGGQDYLQGFGLDVDQTHTLAAVLWGEGNLTIGGMPFNDVDEDIFIVKMDLSEVLSSNQDLSSQNQIIVAPNPVTDVLRLTYHEEDIRLIRILDDQGKVIQQHQGGSAFDVSPLPSGSYYLHLITSQHQMVRKFVKTN